MTIRNELSQSCLNLSFDALPEDVVQHTKVCLMDHICLMVAGQTTYLEDYPDIANFMNSLGGKEESTIVGTGDKIPCLHATLVNTAVGVSTSFDAMHKSAILHLPAVLFPATIAVAEKQKASGRDLILAIIAGTEIMARIGMCLGPRNAYARGFHPTSICGPFGCAAAAGRLLGLGQDEMAEALSIAAVQAAGSSVWAGAVYPATWSFQIARAAQSGVLSAMLAQIGFCGVENIFEDERGFLNAHSESPDLTKLTEEFGRRYEITELTLKRFGVGIYILTSIEVLLEMLETYEIAADKIEEITVKLPTVVIPLVGFPEYPENRATAYVSTRYVLAVTALLGNEIAYSMEPPSAENRKDPRVIDLFNRIKVIGDPELDKVFPELKPCTLTIKTKDGKEFSQRNDGPFKGDPENPLSPDDIETKFTRMTVPVLGREKTVQMISAIKELETLDDVSKLVALLTSRKSP